MNENMTLIENIGMVISSMIIAMIISLLMKYFENAGYFVIGFSSYFIAYGIKAFYKDCKEKLQGE